MDFTNVKEWTIPEGNVKKAWIGSQLVWQSEVPKPYDAEIQWLRSNGDCSRDNPNYIALWHVPDKTSSRWEIRYQFDDSVNNHSIGIGYALRFFRIGSTVSTGRLSVSVTNKSGYITPLDQLPHTFDLDCPGGKLAIDGTTVYEGEWSNNTPFPVIPIVFNHMAGLQPATGNNAQRPATFYWSKWYENGVLVEDVIPVRIGTVGYLYDKVSGELHGLQGDGTLTLGPDVN